MNKKLIISISFAFLAVSMIYIYFLGNENKNFNEKNFVKKVKKTVQLTDSQPEKINEPTPPFKNVFNSAESFSFNKQKPFNEKSIKEIKRCVPVFFKIEPRDLLGDIPLNNSDFFHHKVNLHYKTSRGNVYQIRKENGLNNIEILSYVEKNGLPELIKLDDITEELKSENITYKENRQILKKGDQILEAIVINDEIVKIDYKNKKATLSCDLFKNDWECLCARD